MRHLLTMQQKRLACYLYKLKDLQECFLLCCSRWALSISMYLLYVFKGIHSWFSIYKQFIESYIELLCECDTFYFEYIIILKQRVCISFFIIINHGCLFVLCKWNACDIYKYEGINSLIFSFLALKLLFLFFQFSNFFNWLLKCIKLLMAEPNDQLPPYNRFGF